MNPKQFLFLVGLILVVQGVLGFAGVIGPSIEDSVFGKFWWFDTGENWSHLLIGIFDVGAAFLVPVSKQRPLVLFLAGLGIFFGGYGLFTERFLGSNLENPADTILHLSEGVWGLFAGTYGARRAATSLGSSAAT